MNAFPSPTGTKMVPFAASGLWIMPASGGTATKDHPMDVESTQPAWSPTVNGLRSKIIHRRELRDLGGQVRRIATPRADERTVRRSRAVGYPDSSKVIFSASRSPTKSCTDLSLRSEEKITLLQSGVPRRSRSSNGPLVSA